MRNALGSLILLGVAALAVIVLLPVLGAIFLVVALVLALVVGFFLAAPLLARLPWFRDRIVVRRYGRSQTIRFDRDFSTYKEQPRQHDPEVIDVEGRQIAESEEDSHR